jgi:spoIIIJ-associated protein
MESAEVEAKTIEEAITIACEQLKTSKENLAIEVLQDEPSKIMAFMSGKKAKIRATVKSHTQMEGKDSVESLREFLETVVKKILPDANVEVKTENEGTIFNILGDGSGIFIGKKGQTLDALQYILNKIMKKNSKDFEPVLVDSESYRSRHKQSLISMAKKLSERAKKRRGPVSTSLLSPSDRRIVHMTIKNNTELTTWSKGEGLLKKVFIAPKNS